MNQPDLFQRTPSALPPVPSEPLLCLLDAVRELVAAYDEYERDQSATCARCCAYSARKLSPRRSGV